MNRPPPSVETPVALPHIWSGLPADLQHRTVRLLAQLAYARLRRHVQSNAREIHNDHSAQQSQDPT
jgi:hypothetical protein